MFTGLIRARGAVALAERRGGGLRLGVEVLEGCDALEPLAMGDSVAVNGCCLSLVARGGGMLEFDVIQQTLSLTTLGDWRAGSLVHLEAAVRAGQPLGGHIVQGHVDGAGTVLSAGEEEGGADGRGYRVRIQAQPAHGRWLLEHGSVAVDGVSLTLASIDRRTGQLEVALIPETLRATNLGRLRKGDAVNLEFDQLAKAIAARLDEGATPPLRG